MATITASASGGTRAWSDTATWVGGVKPTASDDVLLTGTSGNVTIDTGAVGRSLNCTGYTGTLTHTAAVILTLGDSTAGLTNVALKFAAGMTYTQGSTSTSEIDFVSTSATQQTIDAGGKQIGTTRFLGVGSSYLLSSSYLQAGAGNFNLQAGTLDTNNLAHSFGSFSANNGANAKTFTMGSSAISMVGNTAAAIFNVQNTTTFTANTATITFTTGGAKTGIGASVATNLNGASVVFAAASTDANVSGNLTMANLTFSGVTPASATLTFSGNPTITGATTITGSTATKRPLVQSDTPGTSRTITTATFSLSNADFSDITAAGAGGTWTGTSMGDCLGNSNITFDSPATQTHTSSAGGTWSDVSKWTSRVPLPQDNVVVGSGTTGTLTVDMPRLGADITFSGFAGTASFSSLGNTMYGGLILGSGMTLSGTQTLTLSARSSKTITSNGKSFNQTVAVSAPGGTYTLVDSFQNNSAFLNIVAGSFSSANFNISVGTMNVSAGSTGVLGTTTVTLTSTSAQQVFGASGASTLSAASATLVVANASTNARSMLLGGKNIGTITYTVAGSTGSLTFTSAAFINTLNFSDASNARSLLFTAGTTTSVNNFNVVGTAGNLMTIDSATAATHTLLKPTGTVSTDYLSVKNSIVDAGRWYAGANSTNVSGNTNWTFTIPPTPPTYSFPDDLVFSRSLSDPRSVIVTATVSGGAVLDQPQTLVSTPDILLLGGPVFTSTGTLTATATSQISATLTYQWNVLAPPTPVDWPTFAPAWNVSSVVNATVSSEQWNTLSLVSPTNNNFNWTALGHIEPTVSGYQWGVLLGVGASLDYDWENLAGVDYSVGSHLWNVIGVISKSIDYDWDDLVGVDVTDTVQWETLVALNVTDTIQWETLAALNVTDTVQWETLSAVDISDDYDWDILSATDITRDYDWNMDQPLTQVNVTLDYDWTVCAVVNVSESYQWQTLMVELGVGWAFTWNDLQQIDDTTDTQWGTLASVDVTDNSQWSDLVTVDVTNVFQWSVLTTVSATDTLEWETLSAVVVTDDTQWNTRASVDVTDSTQWNDLTEVGSSSETYNWTVLGHASKSVDFDWSTLLGVGASLNYTWHLNAALFESKTDQWTVLTQMFTTPKDYQWTDLFITSATPELDWNVHSALFDTLSTAWQDLTLLPPYVEFADINIINGNSDLDILDNSGDVDVLDPTADTDIDTLVGDLDIALVGSEV